MPELMEDGGGAPAPEADTAEAAFTRGCGLAGSADVAAARAGWLHHCGRHQARHPLARIPERTTRIAQQSGRGKLVCQAQSPHVHVLSISVSSALSKQHARE